jgi:hypothetical protein
MFGDFRLTNGSGPLPCTDADIVTLTAHRLAGVALRLVSTEDLVATPKQLSALRRASFADCARSVSVVQRSQDGLDALRGAEVPFAVSKGPGIALQSPHPAERPFTDLDLLVHPRSFFRARAVLASLGYRLEVMNLPPWLWFESACQEAINLKSPGGGSLDLHHHLPPWLWARGIDLPHLIAQAEPTLVWGHDLPLVPLPYNLLIVALHIVSDRHRPGATLMAWRDLLVMASATDDAEVLALADHCNLTAWLRWILHELPPDVRPPSLWSVLAHEPKALPHRRRLALITPPAFGASHVIGQALRLPVANSLKYFAGLALPSSQFLRARYPHLRHPRAHWWAASLRGLSRRHNVLN